MGDVFADPLRPRPPDNLPVHTVRLDGFWLGKYPVTQKEWQRVMGRNPSYFNKGDNYPVENVSWYDVNNFIERLNGFGIEKYRLPTEAEWEFGCRSGGKKERYAGGDDIDLVAWYGSNAGMSTHPVGKKAPNGLGLYDMSGNVREWVWDIKDEWHDYYANSPQENPRGPSYEDLTGCGRVVRGGSWLDVPFSNESSTRYDCSPAYKSKILGFRLLRETDI